MKKKLLSILDSFLFSNLWFVYVFLDHPFGRRIFLNEYSANRPAFLERYFKWKPVIGNPRKILIIKNDAIGDYLLFRNFIEEISQTYRPKGFEIHVVGNSVWRELGEFLDQPFTDHFYWLKRGGLNTKPSYETLTKLILDINQNTYSLILYPNISREWFGGDWLVQHIPAKVKIGFDGDLQNQTNEEHIAGNSSYSNLTNPAPGVFFEFYRNREIVEVALGRKSNWLKPEIPILEKGFPGEKYVVFFPGASAGPKQWPKESFIELGCWLLVNFPYRIILAGGPGDIELCQHIGQELGDRCDNTAGKTSLPELLRCIQDASLLVSNDTVALHMGVLSGIPSVCPFKCNHFGRFLPYPKEYFHNLRVCIPANLKSLSEDELKQQFSQNYGDDISNVRLQDVKDAVLELLNQ